MLIIHPEDPSTAMLSILYQGQNCRIVSHNASGREIRHLIYHTPQQVRIMLLGHGSPLGLFFRDSASPLSSFGHLIIRRHHAHALRRHGHNLIGIWCHAAQFARQYGLHGLFSGMIITEPQEAQVHGIPTTAEELSRENISLFSKLRQMLDAGVPLHDIPQHIAAADTAATPLTRFNYRNFHYL